MGEIRNRQQQIQPEMAISAPASNLSTSSKAPKRGQRMSGSISSPNLSMNKQKEFAVRYLYACKDSGVANEVPYEHVQSGNVKFHLPSQDYPAVGLPPLASAAHLEIQRQKKCHQLHEAEGL